MVDTGWVIAGSGTTDATVGTEDWANPGNITADDATYADASAASANEQTYYLKGYNFGLSVPVGAVINGIEFRGQFYDTASQAPTYINYAQVVHPSSGLGNDQETGSQALSGTPTNYDYGGATELHGLSWSAADVNDAAFGVVFSVNVSSAFGIPGDPYCDAIWVKVYYTVAGGSRQVTGGGLTESIFTTSKLLGGGR